MPDDIPRLGVLWGADKPTRHDIDSLKRLYNDHQVQIDNLADLHAKRIAELEGSVYAMKRLCVALVCLAIVVWVL